MSKKSDKVLEEIRTFFHSKVKNLSPVDFREVCEDLHADMEGHLDALQDEEEED